MKAAEITGKRASGLLSGNILSSIWIAGVKGHDMNHAVDHSTNPRTIKTAKIKTIEIISPVIEQKGFHMPLNGRGSFLGMVGGSFVLVDRFWIYIYTIFFLFAALNLTVFSSQ